MLQSPALKTTIAYRIKVSVSNVQSITDHLVGLRIVGIDLLQHPAAKTNEGDLSSGVKRGMERRHSDQIGISTGLEFGCSDLSRPGLGVYGNTMCLLGTISV